MSDSPVRVPIISDIADVGNKVIDNTIGKVVPKEWTDLLIEQPLDFAQGGGWGKLSKKLAAKPGDPPALPEIPTAANSQPALQEAAAGQRRAKGRASTILNNGTGSSSSVGSARRTLLGS